MMLRTCLCFGFAILQKRSLTISWVLVSLGIAIRTGIDGCPVPEHTDLTEASIGCHTTHMIHDEVLDDVLR
jgi:hypothetical protein